MDSKRLIAWQVDYGDGRGLQAVTIPHAWRQDVPVTWEGPAQYRTTIAVPAAPSWLIFHGVSCAARVFIGNTLLGEHRGLWDAFSVSLRDCAGQTIALRVEVVKNGGAAYPVSSIASGFLPFVYHTFGGIYQDVEIVVADTDPLAEPPPAPPCRIRAEGSRISVDGRPFFPRGVLTWGWYPEIGHTNPPEELIRRELRAAKRLGFNLVKFCLWVPSHPHLEICREEGMEAWLELPLWNPSSDQAHLEGIAREVERIVRQYRRHDNILLWTVGCELSAATPPEYRHRLYRMVRELTGCPLVKDNSGSAEMYGGDLREFGDFYDFHPYCDTPFYPPVLDSLLPGPRPCMPLLLGEFNDIDVHRDLARLRREQPFWASPDPDLNAQGVRWQYDLPDVLAESRFAREPSANGHGALMESARRKALFMRKTVQEAVRARDAISGYVVTGWCDTPISSAGFRDDWESARFTPKETLPWNGPACLFLIPIRRPPWVRGGNRPGWMDPLNHFAGQVFWRVGIHSEQACAGQLRWRVTDALGETVGQGTGETVSAAPLEAHQIAQISWQCDRPGDYRLHVEFAGAANDWPLSVRARFAPDLLCDWQIDDPAGLLEGLTGQEGRCLLATHVPGDLAERLGRGERIILLLHAEATAPAPFWRESAYEFLVPEFWERVGMAEQWHNFLPVSGDCVIDLDQLRAHLPDATETTVLMNRIDTRTYAETPVLLEAAYGNGHLLATTLRPYGGLGIQPFGVTRNPSGAHLLSALLAALHLT